MKKGRPKPALSHQTVELFAFATDRQIVFYLAAVSVGVGDPLRGLLVLARLDRPGKIDALIGDVHVDIREALLLQSRLDLRLDICSGGRGC